MIKYVDNDDIVDIEHGYKPAILVFVGDNLSSDRLLREIYRKTAGKNVTINIAEANKCFINKHKYGIVNLPTIIVFGSHGSEYHLCGIDEALRRVGIIERRGL